MRYAKLKIENEEYLLIGEYEIANERIFKFVKDEKVVFCKQEKEKYSVIKDEKMLKEIEKFFNVNTDVIFK